MFRSHIERAGLAILGWGVTGCASAWATVSGTVDWDWESLGQIGRALGYWMGGVLVPAVTVWGIIYTARKRKE